MARSIDAKCRKCRRAMEKLFLKGDRCASPKCAMVRRPSFPGVHGRGSGRGQKSEYGIQLAAKQKIKRIYGVLEKQFRKHFDDVKNKEGIAGDLLMARLEKRFDNVIFRLGFATSRAQARQLVNHGMFFINGKKNDIPSTAVKIGDVITIKSTKKEKNYFKNIDQAMKNKKDFPSWMTFDASKMEAQITGEPKIDEIGVNVDAQVVVEYYSR